MVKAEIEGRFSENLERVAHLVQVYSGTSGGPGRPSVEDADVLRAAVVFLHATVEDLLRSLLAWRLPGATASHLKDIPLAGKKPRSSFTVEDLAGFRGSTVDDVIVRSVAEHLDRSNFNNPGEVEAVIVRIGLPTTLLDPYRDKLGPMMTRRHWIVHRADRNTATGRGQHAARGLKKATVETWADAVKQFGAAVLGQL
jgi:hypothetical protein